MAKLSPTQQRAMNALPLKYIRWGSSNFGNDFPEGVTMATINRLHNLGLVRIVREGPFARKVIKK